MDTTPAYFKEGDAIVTAASNGEYDAVSFLIAHGADVNTQDESGNTGIMCAAEHGYDAIIELLVAAGGSVNICNNDGDRALDFAKYAKCQSTVDLLGSLGAIGCSGPSAKERMEDAFYDACEVANSIKSGLLGRRGQE